jgi:hypothetical protein
MEFHPARTHVLYQQKVRMKIALPPLLTFPPIASTRTILGTVWLLAVALCTPQLATSQEGPPKCPCVSKVTELAIPGTSTCTDVAVVLDPNTDGACIEHAPPPPDCLPSTRDLCLFTVSVSITAKPAPPQCCATISRALNYASCDVSKTGVFSNCQTTYSIPVSVPFTYVEQVPRYCGKGDVFHFVELSNCAALLTLLRFKLECRFCI